MGRRKKGEPPAYRLHKASGLAYVILDGREVYLGKHGTPESHASYEAHIRDWRRTHAEVKKPAREGKRQAWSVADLIDAYLDHSKAEHRRPDGTPTSTTRTLEWALQPLLDGCGNRPCDDVGARELKAIRDEWVAKGASERTVIKAIGSIRAMYRWAHDEHGAVGPEIIVSLQVPARGGRETEEILPVAWEVVQAVLPRLHEQGQAMVTLQWLTGIRPGEVCGMKGEHVHQDGQARFGRRLFTAGDGLWIFQPPWHKTRKKKKHLAYVLGPKAQAVLAPWLTLLKSPTENVFQPRRTPFFHGPGPGLSYDEKCYYNTIRNACDRAFPPPAPLARREGETWKQWRSRLTAAQREEWKAWRREHRFAPNRIRHSYVTRADSLYGIEDASKAIGHSQISTSAIYIERNLEVAARIAREIG